MLLTQPMMIIPGIDTSMSELLNENITVLVIKVVCKF